MIVQDELPHGNSPDDNPHTQLRNKRELGGDFFEWRLPDHSVKRLVYLLLAIGRGSTLGLGVLMDAKLTPTDVRVEIIRRELAGDGVLR